MNMREKIARAIARAVDEEMYWGSPAFLRAADNALNALMEPTEGMVGAFHRMCDDNGTCLVKPGFQAMIRAAKEGK